MRWTTRAWLGWGLATALSLLAACGGRTEGRAEASIPLENLGAVLAAAECDSIGDCCATAQFDFDRDACVVERSRQFIFDGLVRDKLVYDGQAAAQCSAKISAMLECGRVSNTIYDSDACINAITGKVKLGEPCERHDECERPATGLVTCAPLGADGGPQVCQPMVRAEPRRGKVEEACERDCADEECPGFAVGSTQLDPPSAPTFCYRSDNLHCSPRRRCEELVSLGMACTYSGCRDGLWCGASHTCEPRAADGEACSSHDMCLGGVCGDGICWSAVDALRAECGAALP
jgi:hypothetical protein